VQRLPVRRTVQIVGQGRVIYAFRRHDAADAQGGKRKCALPPLRLVQVIQKHLDQFLQYLLIRPFHCVAAPHDVRWQGDQRAARLVVVEVVSREVGINDPLAARLTLQPWMRWLRLPRLGCIGAKEPADSLGIEFVLVPEMTLEPSSRQTGVLHDFIDRDLGKPLFVEEAPRAFQDSLARVALMLG
jgi:hypothetical protein